MISRNGNRMQRFEEVLALLPKGRLFDGEIVDGAAGWDCGCTSARSPRSAPVTPRVLDLHVAPAPLCARRVCDA
jgi:hypothetical protein